MFKSMCVIVRSYSKEKMKTDFITKDPCMQRGEMRLSEWVSE